MTGILTLRRTSIGKKIIMAVTGLIMIGFLIGHMYGNLKIFGGQEHFNAYAEGLRLLGEPIFGYGHLLFITRLALLATIGLHVWASVTLGLQNKRGRLDKYINQKELQASLPSSTMSFGGKIIFLFILFHLMQFTFGVPGIHTDFIVGDPYHNLVTGFQSYRYLPAIFYVMVLSVLGFHLTHGAWSLLQTLGLNKQSYTQKIKTAGLILAIVIWAGFISVPIAVMAGIVKLQ